MKPRVTALKTGLVAALVLLHVGSALLAGAPRPLRTALWPAISWYAEGLLMINTWGMFSRPPGKTDVVVRAVYPDGSRAELASTIATRRGGLSRVLDVRLRKLQSKLAKPELRDRFGREYLRYFCRDTLQRGHPARRVELFTVQVDAAPGATGAEALVLGADCAAPAERSAPSRAPLAPSSED